MARWAEIGPEEKIEARRKKGKRAALSRLRKEKNDKKGGWGGLAAAMHQCTGNKTKRKERWRDLVASVASFGKEEKRNKLIDGRGKEKAVYVYSYKRKEYVCALLHPILCMYRIL